MTKLTVVVVSPSVVRFNEKIVVVEYSEAIHNVGAEGLINVLRPVLALALPVPRPIGEVADNLVPICGGG